MEGIKRSILDVKFEMQYRDNDRQKAKMQRSHTGDKFRKHQNRNWMRSLRKKV